MTVRELINILLDYDADETIDFVNENSITLEIKEFGKYADLPYIMFQTEQKKKIKKLLKRY